MAQLLIDMPAESASRLLTLSLLEQLSVHGTRPPQATPPGDPTRETNAVPPRADAYRAVVNRLRGCIALYAEALDESIPRKVRRKLRALAKATNDLHDVDVQRAWLARIDHTGQSSLAAQWVRDRLTRRRERFGARLARVQEDERPLRQLAKRMSVYTTAIQLDELHVSISFGALTGQRLAAAAPLLRASVMSVTPYDDSRSLQRVRRASDYVVYLLEPVRSTAEAEPLTESVHALRIALERIRELVIVADALVAGGRRVGALQMMTRVRRTVQPCDPAREADEGGVPALTALPDEVAPGLLSLAERLREERAQAFADFASLWLSQENDTFFSGLERFAGVLGAR